ncbi:MAG: shikimate dehydrogenase [Coprococcus sp.]|nr:shikimate dehydrogenase [Coprococcus sp.]
MGYEITGHTVLTGLLGSPVAHSISPMMHNEAFRQLGLDYAYLAFDVGTDRLEIAVEGLRAMGARGFNLTMPDKNLMCALADKLSPASEIGGAVNTVVNDNGVLTGHTTDGIGFMRSVAEEGWDIIGKKITLLGAGGAAAAIMIQAALDGVAEISIFNIRDDFFIRAKGILEKLRAQTSCTLNLYDFSDPEALRKEIAESVLLVNGTAIGMAPNVDRCIITDDSLFRKDLYVFDVIYNPEETLFLKKARAAGCAAANGLNMLLYQGAASFELWTGREMPVDIIKGKYFKR